MRRRRPRAGEGGAGRAAAAGRRPVLATMTVLAVAATTAWCGGWAGEGPGSATPVVEDDGSYPWHTDIPATTFWVGEVLDPAAPDGSQMFSAFDSDWYAHYGGCDGVVRDGVCLTERRTAANGYFPTQMTPLENPFYLDLPYDDVNHPVAFARRGEVVPWADEPEYRQLVGDPRSSLMKNRWVRLVSGDRECYGQIEDAGPGVYDDEAYVFGHDDRRPANREFEGAGLDVSPALNGCLGFTELNGSRDLVDWRFVDAEDVPDGPWLRIVTTRGVG